MPQELVTHFFGPHRDVILGCRIVGQNLEHLSNLHLADPFLGFQQGTGAGTATGVHYRSRLDRVEIYTGHGVSPFSSKRQQVYWSTLLLGTAPQKRASIMLAVAVLAVGRVRRGFAP